MPITTTGFKPTEEQQACIDTAKDASANIMVNAFAGCAKSTTSELMARATPVMPSLSLAFNKKIADATRARFPSHFEVLTMNGLGHRAWSRTISKRLTIVDKKLGKLTTEVVKATGVRLNGDEWDELRRLAQGAMMKGLVPEKFSGAGRPLLRDTEDSWQAICDDLWIQSTPTLVDLAREIITRDILAAYRGEISFDDQIYCSTMLNGAYTKFPLVMVDEAQDLSPLNHVQLARCSSDRLIVVGDPLQAIYAFRGADTQSMSRIRDLRPMESWVDLPLSTTFRCPKLVVERQQHHARGFNAAPSNPSGSIKYLDPSKDEERLDGASAGWTWAQIEVLASRTPAAGRADIVVLCRNNAPLLSLAFKLIRQQVSVQMLGRDIGKGLQVLARKIIPEGANAGACYSAVNAWRDKERQLAKLNQQEEKLAGIEDRAECLLATLAGANCRDREDLLRALDNIFGREVGRITLSTIHRAKGLEYDFVLHLDPWRIPSRHAQKQADLGDPRQLQQEFNLQYVCETRPKHTLAMASLKHFIEG